MQKAGLLSHCWEAGQAPDPQAHALSKAQFVLIDDFLTITSDDLNRLERELDEYERHSAD